MFFGATDDGHIGISEGCNYDDADNGDVNDSFNVILGHDTYMLWHWHWFRDMGELDEVASLAERGALMYRQVSKRGDYASIKQIIWTIYGNENVRKTSSIFIAKKEPCIMLRQVHLREM